MIDFEFYKLNYKGAVIADEEAFEAAVVEARAYVDALIIDRSNMRHRIVREAYKKAICAAADEIHRTNTVEKSGGVLVSESVGNHSKTYKDTVTSSEERNSLKNKKVRMYLANTGLLYRGIG